MSKQRPARLTPLIAALGLLGIAQQAQAVDFSYSGFGNVTAGRVIGDNGPFAIGGNVIPYPDQNTWSKCPCAIVDFVHSDVYEKRWSVDTESKLGLQGTASFNDAFSVTGQLMLRTMTKKAKANLEWLYLTYNLSPSWTLQLGRKRVPLLNYSDFQDVAFAYPWVRVPFDVYGWEVTNYNGGNITYRGDFKGWAVKSNAYMGSERLNDNPMGDVSDKTVKLNTHWKDMWGLDLELNRDWFTVRGAINRSMQHMENVNPDGTVVQTIPDLATYGEYSRQTFYSLSFSADYNDFIGRLEFQKISRGPADRSFDGILMSAGYRIGKFTPTVFGTSLRHNAPGIPGTAQVDSIRGVVVRYAVSDTSSFKLQWDRITWDNPRFMLRRDVLAASYDFVF